MKKFLASAGKAILAAFRIVKRSFASVGKAALVTAYILIAAYTTMLTGCASMMPTRESPIAEPLGYDVWDYKGWTFVFMTEAKYNIEVVKLRAYKETADLINKPFLDFHTESVDLLNIALSGTLFGGMSFAWRRLPRGAVKKEDYEKAGLQDPDEFKKTLA